MIGSKGRARPRGDESVSLTVAFLRGIGPARKAPGDALRRCLGEAGYETVVPVLASGNVIFGPSRARPRPDAIEAILAAHFGYAIPVVLRSAADIAAMIAADPFAGIDLQRQTRFVSMLAADAPDLSFEPPPDAGFAVIERRKRDLFVTRDNEKGSTVDMMAALDRVYRKKVTTRNWNTIERIAGLLDRT